MSGTTSLAALPLQELFISVGIALGLGLLVGLQREKSESGLAGVRTFPLVTILGTVAGLLAREWGGSVLAAMVLAIASLVVVGNVLLMRQGSRDAGLTSEFAILLMFGVGAILASGPRSLAVALGGLVAVLLHAKEWLHGVTERLDRGDLTAIMRFALISLVILPVLPDRAFGPFRVLNPSEIWLMVVLVVGISLGGYIVYRFFGAKAGVLAGGLLGGVISSTATTVSYARRSRGHGELAWMGAAVVMIANAVVMVRVLIEIRIAGPSIFREALGPIGVMLVVQALLPLALWWRSRHDEADLPPQDNPAELKPALLFAALYALVLLGVASANAWFGQRSLYLVAVISGLTDVDAITLSTSRLAQTGQIGATLAWRLIILAAMANLVFKAGIVAVLGEKRMFGIVAGLSAISVATGGAILMFWR